MEPIEDGRDYEGKKEPPSFHLVDQWPLGAYTGMGTTGPRIQSCETSTARPIYLDKPESPVQTFNQNPLP